MEPAAASAGSRSLITVAERLFVQGAYDEEETLLLDAQRRYEHSDIDTAMIIGTRAKGRLATTWLNRANMLRLQGKSDEAADLCARAAWFCREVGWPPGQLRAGLIDAVIDLHGRDESKRGSMS